MIELSRVSKSYAKSGVKAVNDADVTVKNGEIFGFLGPNGAGKTTTIKLMTGVLKPDSGTVSIDGIDMAERALDAKRRFGYVTDNPELFARLKASEYLNFVADVYGVDTADRRERVERYASLFEIKDVLNASIGSYSHGMKQKLLVTASLVHDPDNWILDEPMVGLDPRSSFNLKELMRERVAAGKTVFFSTHVMEVAERLCDRLSIINKGAILFTGTLAELKTRGSSDSSLEKLFLELVDDKEEAKA
ncbi:MAG: ABC transporter ATP-binding protein [Spirochaetia bacterium]|nr:ABC transporter ATP-binding protein [Spirochaetia bacterium]